MLVEFESSFPVGIRVCWSIIQAFRGPITDLDKKLGRPAGHTQKKLICTQDWSEQGASLS